MLTFLTGLKTMPQAVYIITVNNTYEWWLCR